VLNVEDMSQEEMRALVARVGFGHLGCVRGQRPYVVPMHYAYDSQDFYLFTTEGTKTEAITENPEVCLQVEEVKDAAHWQSVMVNGHAERITDAAEMERAMRLITEANPTLTPALNLTQIDAWGRANHVAIYRVRPEVIDGRKTL
jgi:nitroimidazol reductase NimA-like FMN-containing flavoprotein (pyridoxamine 5'-phosphate oxidase superfamily)